LGDGGLHRSTLGVAAHKLLAACGRAACGKAGEDIGGRIQGNMKKKAQVELSHLSPSGEARMVDVSQKEPTQRTAVASARLRARPEVLDALIAGQLPKGEALSAARVAGVLAAKRTGEWIPLCHPLPLDWAQISFAREQPDALLLVAIVKTRGPTGVEMEALTAVSAAALTLYDMAKAADKSISIGPVQLERKSGGKSGEFRRTPGSRA
jgi:cyclic pyranopterin phosphate synthase